MNASAPLNPSRSPSPDFRLTTLRRQSEIVSQTLGGKPAIERHGSAARRSNASRRHGRGPKCIKKGKDGGPVWPGHLFHLFCLGVLPLAVTVHASAHLTVSVDSAVGMVKSEQQNGKQSKERQNEAIAQWYLKLTGLSRSAQQGKHYLRRLQST